MLKRMGFFLMYDRYKWLRFTLCSGCDLSFSHSDFQSCGFTSSPHNSVSLPDFCRIDELLCKDENAILSFEAIRSIHKQMDDDANGNVDVVETDGVSRSKRTVINSGLNTIFELISLKYKSALFVVRKRQDLLLC